MSPPHRASIKSRRHQSKDSLSPPLWKDQLKQRCLQRLHRDRQQVLDRLRSPDANVSNVMKHLVDREHSQSNVRRQILPSDDVEAISIEELRDCGKLSEEEYFEIIHALEEDLAQEMEEPVEDEAAFGVECEDDSLEAMLANLELDEMDNEDDVVLCPVCKRGAIRVSSDQKSLLCSCGFTYAPRIVKDGLMEDFQQVVGGAFASHRQICSSDPDFRKVRVQQRNGDFVDSILLYCRDCHSEQSLTAMEE